jgi:hypothetical protein
MVDDLARTHVAVADPAFDRLDDERSVRRLAAYLRVEHAPAAVDEHDVARLNRSCSHAVQM